MQRLIGPLLVVIVFSALPILPSQADAQGATCRGLPVTINMSTNGGNGNGTNGPDVILGTSGADTINGFGGADTICAGGGNDIVQGGTGDDVIYGENGNDKLFGAQGADIINGGSGDDTIHGNLGNDKLYGEGGADRIFGYGDDDLIEGGDGDDRLHGNYGNDTISGDAGDDHIFGYGDNDTLDGGDGNDLIGGNFGDDVINGGPGNDNLYGSDGSDMVNGGAGNDIVHGNSGDDTLNGNSGNDTLDGGIGFDVCVGNGGVDTATRCEKTTGVPATPVPATPAPPTATPKPVPPVAATPTTVQDTPNPGPSAPIPEPGTDYTVAFEEDFLEAPSLDRFRWQIHHAIPFKGSAETWQGDHDRNCGPPTTSRTINRPDPGTDAGEAAYWCAPAGPQSAHMMTSFRTSGYAQVGFMPDQLFEHVRRVCWDQNQTDLGDRKWTQMVVVPESTFVAEGERLDYVEPRLEEAGGGPGPGAGGVFLTDDVFLFVMASGSTQTHVGQGISEQNYRGFTTLDKARRFRTCIEDLENGTVRIELERETETEVRIMQGAFPDGAARVIFQDDTYNSTKSPSPVENPFTWHWDNISIETD